MLSADATEERNKSEFASLHDGYLMKPVELTALYDQISTLLDIHWHFKNTDCRCETQKGEHRHGHG